MQTNVERNIFISILVLISLYLILALYGNSAIVLLTLTSFRWRYFPVIIIIIYTTFLLKFLRWHYYIRLSKVELNISKSFQIFMSALTMSITPGKMGELIKPYMVKEVIGTPISKTIPIVFAERITEFSSLIFLVMLSTNLLDKGILLPTITFLFFVILLLLLFSKTASSWAIKKISKVKHFRKYVDVLNTSLQQSRVLMGGKSFLGVFVFSVVIWLLEGFGFYVILNNFNVDILFVKSIFTYLFSVFIGAVSFLPAGLGVTDGSITFLLSTQNVSKEIAISSALIIRVATLWLPLIFGLISLFRYNKALRKTNNK